MARSQLFTFLVGELLLGVEVEHVQEVLRDLPITTVPLAHPAITGLVNLGGQVATVIDLRRRLGMPARASECGSIHIGVRSEEETVSLLVDEVCDVVEVGGEAFERPPDTVRGPTRELIRGAYRLPGKPLLILDVARAAHAGEATAAGD